MGTNSGKLNGFLSESFDPETEATPGLDVGQQRHLQDAERLPRSAFSEIHLSSQRRNLS